MMYEQEKERDRIAREAVEHIKNNITSLWLPGDEATALQKIRRALDDAVAAVARNPNGAIDYHKMVSKLQADLAVAREECERLAKDVVDLHGEVNNAEAECERLRRDAVDADEMAKDLARAEERFVEAEARAEAAEKDAVRSALLMAEIHAMLDQHLTSRHASGEGNDDCILGTFDPKVRRKKAVADAKTRQMDRLEYRRSLGGPEGKEGGDACAESDERESRLLPRATPPPVEPEMQPNEFAPSGYVYQPGAMVTQQELDVIAPPILWIDHHGKCECMTAWPGYYREQRPSTCTCHHDAVLRVVEAAQVFCDCIEGREFTVTPRGRTETATVATIPMRHAIVLMRTALDALKGE